MGEYKKNLISVLVPVYNVELYITRCLDSILSQSYRELEIILIDDGSTDLSGKICDEYAEIDTRFVVLHKENGGVTSARKAGLKVATGEYIGFVDPDDWIEPQMYEEMLHSMLETQTDLIHTNRITEAGSGAYAATEYQKAYVLDGVKSDVDFLKSVLDGRFPLVLWLNLFKHTLLNECYQNIPEYFLNGEDYVVITAYMLKCNCITFLPDSFYHYIKRSGSIQHSADVNLMVTTAKQFETISKFIQQSELSSVLSAYMKKCFIRRMIFVINKTAMIKPIPIYIPDSLEKLKGKRIILCGAGTIGNDYYIYLSRNAEYDIVMWIDADPSHCVYKERVHLVKDIAECEYDIVLIAVEKEDLAIQIRESLVQENVLSHKILWKPPCSIIDDKVINNSV